MEFLMKASRSVTAERGRHQTSCKHEVALVLAVRGRTLEGDRAEIDHHPSSMRAAPEDSKRREDEQHHEFEQQGLDEDAATGLTAGAGDLAATLEAATDRMMEHVSGLKKWERPQSGVGEHGIRAVRGPQLAAARNAGWRRAGGAFVGGGTARCDRSGGQPSPSDGPSRALGPSLWALLCMRVVALGVIDSGGLTSFAFRGGVLGRVGQRLVSEVLGICCFKSRAAIVSTAHQACRPKQRVAEVARGVIRVACSAWCTTAREAPKRWPRGCWGNSGGPAKAAVRSALPFDVAFVVLDTV